MKLKALELLEQISTEWCISDANILIDEAIKELEELENRSCGDCKFCKDTYVINIGSYTCHNIKSWMNQSNIIKDFCCNKWENKQ